MKQNELQKQIRIGNHLLGKCIDDLDDRKEWWEIYKIQDAEHLMAIKDGWDRPIELTEEILLKCVFIPCSIIDNHFNISGMCIWKCNDMFLCDKNGIHIKYLHQLQNLYFALTGEELEIKL